MIVKQKYTVALLAAMSALMLTPATAQASIPAKYANCTNFTHYYRHGVGRLGARDHVSSGTPVTTWLRSTAIYNTAMHYNRGLDRDHDYIACERR